MKKTLIALAAVLALTGCGDLDKAMSQGDPNKSKMLGRVVVRDAAGNELDDWSDKRIDDAARDICELIQNGRDLNAAEVYVALRDDELQGTSGRSAAALTTYAKRFYC